MKVNLEDAKKSYWKLKSFYKFKTVEGHWNYHEKVIFPNSNSWLKIKKCLLVNLVKPICCHVNACIQKYRKIQRGENAFLLIFYFSFILFSLVVFVSFSDIKITSRIDHIKMHQDNDDDDDIYPFVRSFWRSQCHV